MNNILEELNLDYLLINSTNEYLVEYSALSENSRYKLTNFSGSTGDALITLDKIYLFVDGRYHTQADDEVYKNITVIKLQLGQKQDEEIKKIIDKKKTLGIVAKKVSQKRLEFFADCNVKLLEIDPINNYTEQHSSELTKVNYEIELPNFQFPIFVSNLEESSYITGLRDFSKDCSSKIWQKAFIENKKVKIFNCQEECEKFLSNYDNEIYVDKELINAHDYSLIKKPVNFKSPIKELKSIKNEHELYAYKEAFAKTDTAVNAIREYIENNDNLSEFDIAKKLKELFIEHGAISLSFNSIVAINEHSALAHYSKNDKNTILKDGDLVLIDCGAYYESGLATDITRVFVKGTPNDLQKKVYTTVLKAFLNAYNSDLRTGFELDALAHKILDNNIDGFSFSHGLGHGIGINVHEAPPNLSKNEIAKTKIQDGMTFTIEPGLYNPKFFGIRLENSCYKENNKTHSFVKMGYEKKLIDFNILNNQEKAWLKDFELL